MLAGLADGQLHSEGELMRICHISRRRFEAQRRELANLGLLTQVDEGVMLTPIGHLHARRSPRADDEH